MKPLLLLLILSPVILFGQMRRSDIVDSINAPGINLRTVSELIGNNHGTVVEHIQAADSGEYVNIVVRVRVVEHVVITALIFLPVATIQAGPIEWGVMSTLTGTPALPPITEGYTIKAVPRLKIAPFGNNDIIAGKLATATVPDLPDIIWETIDNLPLAAAVSLAIAERRAEKMDTVAVPIPEERKMPVDEMHLSEAGYSLLEKLEGFSPTLYALKDGGLTIGFGFFVPYHESRYWNKGITWEQAERIMREKVPQYEDQVKQYINVPLTQTEFDALTMIAYNLGGFSKATSIVNDINNEADLETLQKDWMRFVHSKAPGVMKGLMNRRKDEMKVRSASDYQPERKIQILKNIK